MDSDTHVPKEGYVRLQDIAEKIRNGEKVEPVAVRELLRWFGAARREAKTIAEINAALLLLDLQTDPWFEDQFLDGNLEFVEGSWSVGHGPDRVGRIVLSLFPDARRS